MKKMILSMIAMLFAVTVSAQNARPANEQTSTLQEEWLPSFGAIEISADFDIVLIQQPDSLAPKIVYDTKGSYTSKFKAGVKDKVLRISERSDARRPERTSVTLYFNDRVKSIKIYDANAEFGTLLYGDMLDLEVGGHANVRAEVDIKDFEVWLSGHSEMTLSGDVRYFWLSASTGKVNALNLNCMAAQVDAKSSCVVSVKASDRLQINTSTRAVVNYSGNPDILRSNVSFMGGDINHIQ